MWCPRPRARAAAPPDEAPGEPGRRLGTTRRQEPRRLRLVGLRRGHGGQTSASAAVMTSVGEQRMARVRQRAANRATTARQPRARGQAPPGSTTARGYGWRHQQERARYAPLVAAGRAICPRCRKLILPGTPWDLDHIDHPDAHRLGLYQGPSHASCNRSAAWRKAQRRMASHRRAAQFFNT